MDRRVWGWLPEEVLFAQMWGGLQGNLSTAESKKWDWKCEAKGRYLHVLETSENTALSRNWSLAWLVQEEQDLVRELKMLFKIFLFSRGQIHWQNLWKSVYTFHPMSNIYRAFVLVTVPKVYVHFHINLHSDPWGVYSCHPHPSGDKTAVEGG